MQGADAQIIDEVPPEEEGESQDLEILIYKGIVSSTTHHTNFDLEEPVIPKYTEIQISKSPSPESNYRISF